MKPILFNTEMVRAILDGRKTVTRRLMKPQPQREESGNPPFWHWKDCQWAEGGIGFPASGIEDYAPYKPGDILYVREAWANLNTAEYSSYYYKASDKMPDWALDKRWRPSIHMPKEAARIFLRVTDVYPQLLKEGFERSDKELLKEGMDSGNPWDALFQFMRTWDSTIKKKDLPRYGWEANPWVFVIEFEKVSKDEAMQ